ncbi:MAG: LPS-assembly protein LptD [Bacteroidetes bacterium]|nr:LPS-assembly protein LptD [Bacteroidota bacterium]
MKFYYPVILFSLVFAPVFAQEKDTLNISTIDSVLTSPVDSLISKTSGSDIDTVIYSSASDSLIFFVKDKKMSIYGNGKIQYKQMQIVSANIFVDFEKNNLKAVGEQSDSTGKKMINTPILTEAGESFDSYTMSYNFKTGRGIMTAANTEMDEAFFTGVKIKKVDKITFFIKDGKYTTCDADTPHYYISSSKMKMVQDEELVAEWIWLNFGGVPFPIPLPFGVIPMQSGRRSGMIAPVFGTDATFGSYIGRFGYFWAINDYMDWNITADYYTRGSINLNSRFRYAKRYSYTGSIQGSYSDFSQGEKTDPDFSEQIDWRLKWYHNQSITPTLRLDVNLEFISTNFLSRNVSNLNDLLRNEIVSNATFSKTWEESGNSMNINYNRRQVIETNDVYEILPNITFSKAQSYPFRDEFNTSDRAWYEFFGYTYNGFFQNNRNKVDGQLNIRGGFRHNINMDFSPKIGFFSITPKFRYEERWYNKKVEKFVVQSSTGEDSVVTNDVNEINFVRSFNTGISASTKFFGIFGSPFPGISSIRHTVTPSITYSFRPDFSEPGWGYYDSYTKSDGTEVRYNKFEREIFGGPSSQQQSSLSFNIGNIFEMKSEVDPTDTTDKEEKYQLLNLNIGSGYNFAADTLKFSDIRLSYRTRVSDFFDFAGSNTFTLYDYSSTTSRINKFLIDQGKGLLRMTSFNFTVTTRLSGERLKSKDTGKPLPSTNQSDEFGLGAAEQRNVYQGIYTDRDPDFAIPWDIALTYTFNLNRQTPETETKFSSINGSLNFNLTPNWKFSITGSYDIERKEFVAPQIKISRDLHAWFMNFTWNPIGTYQGFRFEIRVKAPQLQDLKLTKQDRFYTTNR